MLRSTDKSGRLLKQLPLVFGAGGNPARADVELGGGAWPVKERGAGLVPPAAAAVGEDTALRNLTAGPWRLRSLDQR